MRMGLDQHRKAGRRVGAMALAPMLLSFWAVPSVAADADVCAAVLKGAETIESRFDDLMGEARGSRMALIRIGSGMAIAAAYASDESWPEPTVTAFNAIRDAKNPDADGTTLSADEAPRLVLSNYYIALETVAEKCPDMTFPDLSAYDHILE